VTRDATVANQLGLLYTHPCLTLLVGLERGLSGEEDREEETTLLVRLAFKNLGDIETGNVLGLR
jgi:hypothetical protein